MTRIERIYADLISGFIRDHPLDPRHPRSINPYTDTQIQKFLPQG